LENCTCDSYVVCTHHVLLNPTSGVVTIKTESENSYGLAVYDLLGKRVLQENSFRDGMCDLSALPKGTYLIQVSQDGHQVVKKVVIQ